VAHRTARLNVFGRELLVGRVLIEGWTVSTAARAQGISRATCYKWVRRFRDEGRAGLVDRSSRPRRSPRSTPAIEIERIVAARIELRWALGRG
jgi:transposase